MLMLLFLALAAGVGWFVGYFRGYWHGTIDTRRRIEALARQYKAEQQAAEQAAYDQGADDAVTSLRQHWHARQPVAGQEEHPAA